MMGRLDDRQPPLFYDFCLEDHVPDDHLLRQVAKVLDLSGVRRKLAPYYSDMGRPSLDPELMIRMLLVGYLYGIRSERRLVEEVHLNLAYRWFTVGRRLILGFRAGEIPGASMLKAHAWKVCMRETVSRVRIPLPPPVITYLMLHILLSF